jgi:hypothetical protein
MVGQSWYAVADCPISTYLLSIDSSAERRCWCKPGIGCDLSSVVIVVEQHFVQENRFFREGYFTAVASLCCVVLSKKWTLLERSDRLTVSPGASIIRL